MIPMAAPTSRFILCPVGTKSLQSFMNGASLLLCPSVTYLAGGGGPKCIGYSFIYLSTEQTHIHAMHQGLFCSGEQDDSGLLSSWSFRGGTSKRWQSTGRERNWHLVQTHCSRALDMHSSAHLLSTTVPLYRWGKKRRGLAKITG